MKQAPIVTFDTTSARARSEALRLTKTIVTGLRDVARLFWDVGRALEEFRAAKLFGALGYATFREYVEAELAVAATQAYLMIRVVQAFTREDVGKLEGLERAGALITYARTLGTKVDPGTLVREDVLIGDKPASLATVRDIRVAVNALRAERVRRRGRAPAARKAKKVDAALVAELRSRHQQAGLGRGTITVSGDEVVVRFSRAALARHFGV